MFSTHRIPARVASFVIVIVLFGATFGVGRIAEAQEDRSISDGFTLLAFDVTLGQIEDIEAAQLAAKMVLSNAESGLLFVGRYSDIAKEPQGFNTADEAKMAVDRITEELESNVGGEPVAANLSEMLEHYASFLEQLGSVTGGRMVVLSAGRFTYHESAGVGGLADVASEIASHRVMVDTVSLATTSGADREVLATISGAGGGIAYDLGFFEGVIEFIDDQLNVVLHASLRVEEAAPEGETIIVDVPPHSSYLVAGFAFEDEATNNVIVQSNGQEISDSVGSVSVISISEMKFFTVRYPQPGLWTLRSSGGSGPLTIYSDVVNEIRVEMPTVAPFPTGLPIVMTANARIGDMPLIDSSAMIRAVVTGPDGGQATYELHDRGEGGDAYSEDGTFSATVPAQELVGLNEVQLSMQWPNISASIDGAGIFVVEPFPTIEISVRASDDPVEEGARTQLATVDLKLGEHPFLAEQDGINVSVVNTDDGSEVPIELEPTEVVDGKVYQLRVFGALTMPAEYMFNATMRGRHLEREFKAMAVEQSRSIEIAVSDSILIYSAIGVGAFIVFLFLLLLVRSSMQVRPHGYLYRVDGQGQRELVADFGAYRRSPWDALMNKPIVPAAALPGVPLLGGRFVFSPRGLAFRYRPESDGLLRMTVRGEALQAGYTDIAGGEEFNIESDSFVFDPAAIVGEVVMSERLQSPERTRNAELDNFALDPMTWDAPSSARPTRRHY